MVFFDLKSQNKNCFRLRPETFSLIANCLGSASKDLPEAADLLNQLKARRKKSRADLADMEAVLGLLGGLDGSN
jgi:hypothetical protein